MRINEKNTKPQQSPTDEEIEMLNAALRRNRERWSRPIESEKDK